MKKIFFRYSYLISSFHQAYTPRWLRYILLLCGIFLLIGCSQIAGLIMEPTATPWPTATALPTLTNTPVPPTATPNLPTGTPTPSLDLSLIPERLSIYPVPKLYAGDWATFQVTAYVPEQISLNTVDVDIYINDEFLVRQELDGRNLGGDARAIVAWAWDTSQAVGDYTITMVLDPDDKITVGDEDPSNNRHELYVTVLPDNARPLLDANAAWVTQETDYAYIHVIAGTAAERDLPELVEMTDKGIAEASERLAEIPKRKFDVYFIDRVIGQGGYAGSAMVVSYLDRNYSGGDIYNVLVHEAIHLLDRQFVGDGRLNFLAEGVAVWGTGGHYKTEDLQGRAKALYEQGLYVPLPALIDDFYPVQHEIGYLQAGAFVEFLVAQYGWPAVREFYTAVDIRRVNSRAAEVDEELQRAFGKSLEQLEQEWLTVLQVYDAPATAQLDTLATIRFYNIMRQYQLQYDPTAHFLNAWLPRPNELLAQGFTAELNRHPNDKINLVLESMLTEADIALRNGNYEDTSVLLNSVERVLNSQGGAADPLSKGYFEIVTIATDWGFEVHRVEINGADATVWATNPYSAVLQKLTFSRNQNGWFLLQ